MGSIVELHPLGDDPLGLEAVRELVQIDGFVLERAPEGFDEDVVYAPAPATHGDGGVGVLAGCGKLEAGELATVVGVEDLRAVVELQGVDEGLDAADPLRAES